MSEPSEDGQDSASATSSAPSISPPSPLRSSKPTINLYAEVLTHIRQVTVHATLRTARNKDTKVEVSSNKRVITVQHEGENASLYLPTQIAGTAGMVLEGLKEGRKEVSLRIAVEDRDSANGDAENSASQISEDDGVPWSASDLKNGGGNVSGRCKACETVIIEDGRVKEWKDLPREGWAELLDYWHCHKPDSEEGDLSADAPTKTTNGMLSGTSMRLERGVGLLDITSLFIHEEDCTNLRISAPVLKGPLGDRKIRCASCASYLGTKSRAQPNGNKLRKSRISVQRTQEGHWESVSASVVLVAQLQALIESQGARRFVLHTPSKPPESSGLLLWVFNPSIYYSSSLLPPPPRPHRGMKIFYRSISNHEQTLKDDDHFEEVVLRQDDVAEITADLDRSNAMLPESARTFQDWQVGILDWYEGPSRESRSHLTKHSGEKENTGMEKNPLNERPDEIDLDEMSEQDIMQTITELQGGTGLLE